MYELFLFFICIDAQFTPQTDNPEFGLTRLLSSAFTSSSYVCGVLLLPRKQWSLLQYKELEGGEQ